MYSYIKKILFMLNPENAHFVAANAMKTAQILGLNKYLSQKFQYKQENLSQNLFGLNFANPIGLAGGFDKNADLIMPLQMFGFGFLEYGTFTPRAQKGNDKPRLWRLKEFDSLQNAMGFNNIGSAKIAKNVEKNFPFMLPVFANIGKNKLTPNESAINDYIFLIKKFNELCDAFVINISSPNTPNLRNLQNGDFIKELMSEIKNICTKPLILKIAPDMNKKAAIKLCKTACDNGFKAVILNNTSIDYSLYPNAINTGGISGELIKEKSRELFEAVAKELFGKIILISCGGISSASDALWRIKHGANLLQIYTSFIYKGPSIIKNINTELSSLLKIEGFENFQDAVGVDIKK